MTGKTCFSLSLLPKQSGAGNRACSRLSRRPEFAQITRRLESRRQARLPAPQQRVLPAHQYVEAALNHKSRAAAVMVAITQPVGPQAIDDHRLAAGHGFPLLAVAATLMVAGIRNAQRQAIIHYHVGRPSLRRTHRHMRTLRTLMMVVRRHQGEVAEPGLRLHCMLENITQKDRSAVAARTARVRRTLWR